MNVPQKTALVRSVASIQNIHNIAQISRGPFIGLNLNHSVISNLAILISFKSVKEFSILSPLNIMNRFTLKRWDLLGIYFENKENW